MRIVLTADPELPIPPRHYGGIERIVDMLAHGLVAQGHEVTLFAHPESSTMGTLQPWPGASSSSAVDTVRNALALTRWLNRNRVDIVHSFSRVAYLTPILPSGLPKLMTYQRAISARSVRVGHSISHGTLAFTAISEWMMRHVKHIGHWTMIPNGVPIDRYEFRPTVAPDAPLVFLGRVEEIKGPHLAIEVARRSGRRLIIAGNMPREKRAWCEIHVLPHVDGDRVRYIGSVDDEQKNALLGDAAALLMPILWEEPFGIVMAEAMACGTPVIGLARGAVPEVIDQGVTGFVEEDIAGLVSAVDRLPSLERHACRKRAENLYSHTAVVNAYLNTYRRMIASSRRPA